MTHALPSRPTPDRPLKIGTRGSPLALAQAHETRARLMAAHDLPEDAFEVVVIKTTGDDRALIAADVALKELGGKGLFTKEIEEALIAGRIDIAVHSMKDMPVAQPEGLALTCYLPREDVRDAFVSLKHASIEAIPHGATVGSSSLRRRAQLAHRRPDLKMVEFRGNVQTRMQKLADGVAEATFLAMAGLNRLGMDDLAKGGIAPEEMLPAVAQGAIGIEQRLGDQVVSEMLAAIHDAPTAVRLACERAYLATLDGSCQTPIAGLALLEGDEIWMRGQILRPDGSESLSDEIRGPASQAATLGETLARTLLERAGAGFFDWR